MTDIIIDTNFFLIPYSHGVDIFSEIDRICDFSYRLCIVKGTAEELEKIMIEQVGKHRFAAKLGLSLLKQKSLYMLGDFKRGSVDEAIITASDSNTIVATEDRELASRLRGKGVRIITLRNKNHLELN